MSPVRIKLYGLLSLTRRTYLILQGIVLLVGLGILALGLWYPRPHLPAGGVPTPEQQFYLWLLDSLPYVAGLILLLEGLETVIVLRQFAGQEAEQTKPSTEVAPEPTDSRIARGPVS